MKVAIVGTGISGLTVAHLLHERHEVTVFEATPYFAGHTHTVRVVTPNETHHVDTGFIVPILGHRPNLYMPLDAPGEPSLGADRKHAARRACIRSRAHSAPA